jgi:hypothetical protein
MILNTWEFFYFDSESMDRFIVPNGSHAAVLDAAQLARGYEI